METGDDDEVDTAGKDLLSRLGITVCFSLLLAGCGSQPGATEGETADSSRFELTITRTDREGRLVVTGAYDYRRRQGSMRARLEGTDDAEGDVATEVRFFGKRYYSEQEWEGKTYWVVDMEDEGVGYPDEVIVPFPEADVDPKESLALILAAGEEEDRGESDVRGAATTHYRVKLTPENLSRELDGRRLDETGGPFAIDVWADDARRVRRIRLVEEGTATLTYDFFDFGVAVDVERPPADRIVSQREFDRLTEPTEKEQLELCMEELPKDECERLHGERR